MHGVTVKIINICIAMRCFYTASLYDDMFRPLSSGCTFSYFELNCTTYNVFVNDISCTGCVSLHLSMLVMMSLFICKWWHVYLPCVLKDVKHAIEGNREPEEGK